MQTKLIHLALLLVIGSITGWGPNLVSGSNALYAQAASTTGGSEDAAAVDYTGDLDMNFEVDEFEDFGSEDYDPGPEMISLDQAATAARNMGLIGAAVAGIPALIIGLILGRLSVRRKS
ncbi:hypothetical protein [Aureliella helgolandensis]|nr:hypothetical protein [Aureliella helgolandensis]